MLSLLPITFIEKAALYSGGLLLCITILILIFGGNFKKDLNFSVISSMLTSLALLSVVCELLIGYNPAPVSWFDKLPQTERNVMLNYVKNTHQMITKNEFRFLQQRYQQEIKHKVSPSDLKYEMEMEQQLKALRK